MRINTRVVERVVGVILIIAVLISLINSFHATSEATKSQRHLTEYVQCQAEWTTFLHAALSARGDAATGATQALDDLIDAVTEAKSAEDTRIALERYKQARVEQKKTQQDNPLPAPPSQICQLKD